MKNVTSDMVTPQMRAILEKNDLSVSDFIFCADLAQNAADKAMESIRLVARTAPLKDQGIVELMALRRLVESNPLLKILSDTIPAVRADMYAAVAVKAAD